MNEPLYVTNKYIFIKSKFNFIVYDMDSGVIFHITELLLYLFHCSLLPTLPTMNVSRKNCPVWLSSWLYHSWDFRLDAFTLSQVVGFGAWMAADLPSCWPWISRIHLLLTVCIIQLLKADLSWKANGPWEAMVASPNFLKFVLSNTKIFIVWSIDVIIIFLYWFYLFIFS